eukprot:scaffold680_cov309-Prasinococcus_capsulatus_cf.AAC.7
MGGGKCFLLAVCCTLTGAVHACRCVRLPSSRRAATRPFFERFDHRVAMSSPLICQASPPPLLSDGVDRCCGHRPVARVRAPFPIGHSEHSTNVSTYTYLSCRCFDRFISLSGPPRRALHRHAGRGALPVMKDRSFAAGSRWRIAEAQHTCTICDIGHSC